MEQTVNSESWYVRVILHTENSIGRRAKEAFVVSFSNLRDAMAYYSDRWYMINCTDQVEKTKRKSWTVEKPAPRIPLMDGFRKKRYLSEWMMEWR